MQENLRAYFDEQLEAVLKSLPQEATQLLNEVPLVVEDHPSRAILARLGVRHRSHLCGLYTGIPLTQRRVEHSGVLSDVIHVFREGVLALATTSSGTIDKVELRRQIRLTILHELGHHHGLGEDELRKLGY